jgi:hypothetical protein
MFLVVWSYLGTAGQLQLQTQSPRAPRTVLLLRPRLRILRFLVQRPSSLRIREWRQSPGFCTKMHGHNISTYTCWLQALVELTANNR